jgi:hypothetical protein
MGKVSPCPGDLTCSVLRLSSNVVTIVLMASQLAGLNVVLVIGAFIAGSGTPVPTFSTVVAVDRHITFLEDYFSFLSIGPLIPVVLRPRAIPASLAAGIEFDDVGFAYPGGAEPAVDALNLRRPDTASAHSSPGVRPTSRLRWLQSRRRFPSCESSSSRH